MSTPRARYFWAAALLIAGAAAWPLLAQLGLLNTRGGGDSPFLLQRVQQLVTAVSDGHFPVRWMPDANFGYGYPFYNYYAPLAFYIAGGFYAVGFGLIRAIQLSQLAAFLLAGGAMFGLARRWFRSDWVALFVSVAYTLAPFHLVNVYVRGDSLAEFWAMAFYPLIFWAIERKTPHPPPSPKGRGSFCPPLPLGEGLGVRGFLPPVVATAGDVVGAFAGVGGARVGVQQFGGVATRLSLPDG
jgi:hypothetical protein